MAERMFYLNFLAGFPSGALKWFATGPPNNGEVQKVWWSMIFLLSIVYSLQCCLNENMHLWWRIMDRRTTSCQMCQVDFWWSFIQYKDFYLSIELLAGVQTYASSAASITPYCRQSSASGRGSGSGTIRLTCLPGAEMLQSPVRGHQDRQGVSIGQLCCPADICGGLFKETVCIWFRVGKEHPRQWFAPLVLIDAHKLISTMRHQYCKCTKDLPSLKGRESADQVRVWNIWTHWWYFQQ